MLNGAEWIAMRGSDAGTVPVFRRAFRCGKPVAKAELEVTAMGVYDAYLNGGRVGRFVLAPGWTVYEKRLQVQTYDVTAQIGEENELLVTVANGWYRREHPAWSHFQNPSAHLPARMIARLRLRYADGAEETLATDAGWQAAASNVLLSGIFEGETVDARLSPAGFAAAEVVDGPTDTLIPQVGCEVTEQETLYPRREFRTPKGERVIDFGQNLTGYMAFDIVAEAGERLVLSTAEVMDADGNFYTANYRAARSRMEYTCRDGRQSYKPRFTFFGFRYLRVDEAPRGFAIEQIRAIAVHSDMQRTGWLESDDPMLNQLFHNILWGQKGNFLDVPTDCPQRDERLGWTGDAQVFVRAAAYNYDVRRFFTKWLGDMRLSQHPNGRIPDVVPDVLPYRPGSTAWGDAIVICPWQLYQTYGDESFLADQYDAMRKWVDFITGVTKEPNLWVGGEHYGDWLGLDAPSGSYKGASDDDLVASAFYANAARVVADCGRLLGRDASAYERLYRDIVAAFKARYASRLRTQTEKVLALYFRLTDEPQAVADALAAQVTACGPALQTGFLGTPYLLHALSDYGYTELAYTLLLRKEYPSWLYPVTKGATTVWEHWDGVREDGSFWSADMNSFNHYAYGAVADWVYEVACGIKPAEPGFARAIIAPRPDDRLTSLSARLQTARGEIYSGWTHVDGGIRYEIRTCVDTEVRIGGKALRLGPGRYVL